MKRNLGLMAVLAAMIASSSAMANIVPMSELIDSRTMTLGELIDGPQTRIRSGDKVFGNFTYNATGDMPEAGDINVIPHIDGEGHYGIRFQGGFIDRPGGGASDALITFDAAVMPSSGMLISDAHLAMNGVSIVGPGVATVTETFLPLVDDHALTTYHFGPGNDRPSKLTDWFYFKDPVKKVSVQKDILLDAGRRPEPGTSARLVMLSFVDQTFSQVPEPASCLLLLTGGLWSLAAIRRRRRQA